MKNLSPRAIRALLLSLSLCGIPAFAQEAPIAPSVTRVVVPAQTSALQKAVKDQNWDAARAAIAAGADVNVADKGGVTPLMRVSAARQSELVDLLLQNGADVSALDKKGQSALFYALPEDPKPKKKKFGFGNVLKLASGGLGGALGGDLRGNLGNFGSLLGGGGLESLLGGNLQSLLSGGPFNLGGKGGWSAILGSALQGDAGGKLGIGQLLSGGASNLGAGGWTNLLSSVKGSNPKVLDAMSQINGGNSAVWGQFLNSASSGDAASVEKLMKNPELAPLLQQASAGLGAAANELPGNASRTIIQTLLQKGATAGADRDGNTPATIAQARGLGDIAALFGAQ